MISLHNTIVNFLPDFDFVTGPSLSNVLGPWYAVGAVRSSRLSHQPHSLLYLPSDDPYSGTPVVQNSKFTDSSRDKLEEKHSAKDITWYREHGKKRRREKKGTHPSPPIQRSSLNTLNLSSPSAALTLSLTAPVILSTSSRDRWTAMNSDSGSWGVCVKIWRMRSGYRVIRCTGC